MAGVCDATKLLDKLLHRRRFGLRLSRQGIFGGKLHQLTPNCDLNSSSMFAKLYGGQGPLSEYSNQADYCGFLALFPDTSGYWRFHEVENGGQHPGFRWSQLDLSSRIKPPSSLRSRLDNRFSASDVISEEFTSLFFEKRRSRALFFLFLVHQFLNVAR